MMWLLYWTGRLMMGGGEHKIFINIEEISACIKLNTIYPWSLAVKYFFIAKILGAIQSPQRASLEMVSSA